MLKKRTNLESILKSIAKKKKLLFLSSTLVLAFIMWSLGLGLDISYQPEKAYAASVISGVDQKLTVYEGVGVWNNTSGNILEIGNFGRDIATNSELYLRPNSIDGSRALYFQDDFLAHALIPTLGNLSGTFIGLTGGKLFNAYARPGYTVTQNGPCQFQPDFTYRFTDGNYESTTANWDSIIEVPIAGGCSITGNPLSVEFNYPDQHSQGDIMVGFTSRAWYPTSFEIWIQDCRTNGAGDFTACTETEPMPWYKVVDVTGWNKRYFVKRIKQADSLADGNYGGVRFVFRETNEASNKLQVGEMFLSYGELPRYEGLYASLRGDTFYGDVNIGTDSAADRVLDIFSDTSGSSLSLGAFGNYSQVRHYGGGNLWIKSAGYISLEDDSNRVIQRIQGSKIGIDLNFGAWVPANDAKLAINNPATAGEEGLPEDTIYAYANQGTGAAISANQDGAGYAGYFSGKLSIQGGNAIVGSAASPVNLCLNDDCRTTWPSGGGSLQDAYNLGRTIVTTNSVSPVVISGSESGTVVRLLSGNIANYTALGIGRASQEAVFAITTGSGIYFSNDVAAGDPLLRVTSSTNKIHLGAGSTSPTISVGEGEVGINQQGATASLAVNNPRTSLEVGLAQDTIYAYANQGTGAAISANQDGAGYAGYFSGRTVIMGGNVGIGQANPASTLTINSGASDVGDANNTVYISSASPYPGGALYVEQTNTANNPYAAYFVGPVTVDGVLRVENTIRAKKRVFFDGGFVIGTNEGSQIYRNSVGSFYGVSAERVLTHEVGANPSCYADDYFIPVGWGGGRGINFDNCIAVTTVSNLNDEWYLATGSWKLIIRVLKTSLNGGAGRNADNLEFGFVETGGRILVNEELDWSYRNPEDEHFDTFVYKFTTTDVNQIYYHPFITIHQSSAVFIVDSLILEPDLDSYSVLNNEIDRESSIKTGSGTIIDPSRVGETFTCPRGYVAIGVKNSGSVATGHYAEPICARY